MHISNHEQRCVKKLGKPFTDVHVFLDQFAHKYGMSLVHRMILHHQLGVALVGLLIGPEAMHAARLHVVDDVRRIPAGPEWFLKLPAYVPSPSQQKALAADMLEMIGYAPFFHAAWGRMSSKKKCPCGYPGPMVISRSLGLGLKWWCPWCAAKQTDRFALLCLRAVGPQKH